MVEESAPKPKRYKKIDKYEGFGQELNTSVAYLQAAAVIDNAVAIALDSDDTERLESLAVLWIELAHRLGGGGHHEEDEEGDDEEVPEFKKQPLGFAPTQEDENG